MAVYVDPLINYGWRLGPSCHMTADSLDELYKFGDEIGMRKEWLDWSAKGIPHYDLVKSKRDLAIMHGAIEITGWQNISNHLERLRLIYGTSVL